MDCGYYSDTFQARPILCVKIQILIRHRRFNKKYRKEETSMKTWKLVSGILSIIFFVLVSFQSCAAGIGNALSDNGEMSGSAGLLVAVMMLAGGIVSIATRKGGKGGNIALIVLYGLAALTGFSMAGSYTDLNVWAFWCLVCAVLAIISLVKGNKAK